MRKDFVKKTLKNGIPVYLYRDKYLKKMAVSYNVNYGSLGYYNQFYYEDTFYSMPPAMAHFLEHTLIETSKYGNMLHRFKEKNYEVNGATYHELTSYYFIGIKDTWESIKELIHMVEDPQFSEEAIEGVKGAIIEEVNKNSDDKYRTAFNAAKRNFYSNFEAIDESYNTLGTKESTAGITLEDVKVCYDAYYNDKNKFLVIGGNFEIDEMVDYLEEIYAELESHPCRMRKADYSDDFGVRKEYEELEKPLDTDFAIVKYKIRNDFKERLLLLDLYFYIFLRLKFGSDTDFVTNLIEKKVIIGGISSSVNFFDGVIELTFSADVLDKDAFLVALDKELHFDGLDAYRFDLVKKAIKVGELSKMDYIYANIIRFATGLDFSEKLYSTDVVDEITLEDVKEFIKGIDFKACPKNITYVKKKEAD